MEPFKKIVSSLVKIPQQDIDTDLIIPAEFLTSISKSGYGENLFRRLRDSDPSFVLNEDWTRKAQVLVCGENFGCGSSREHAVWALTGWGFRAVIAPSFADIFTGNSAKNGLLLVALKAEEVKRLLEAPATTKVTIDLEHQEVLTTTGERYCFQYDPFKKHCLMEGIDELDYLLSKKEMIGEYFTRSPVHEFQRPIGK